MKITDIPSEFTIAGFTIKVEIVEFIKDDSLGQYNDIENKIILAKKCCDKELTEEQIIHTFFHELIHTFQFALGSGHCYDEIQANSYANFIREFLNTKNNGINKK